MPRSCQGKKKEEKKNEKNYKKTHIFDIKKIKALWLEGQNCV